MKHANWWKGLTVAAGLVLGCAWAAMADTAVVGGVTWSYELDGGNATVTGANPAKGALMIPTKLGKHPVTSIGGWAFQECSGLTSVTIPDSVTGIGYRAFYGCSGLTNVMIGNGVIYIDNSAFSYCSGLTSVTIGNGVKRIWDLAFQCCSGLTSVTIPNSVTNIGFAAFRGCSGLTNVTIGIGVTTIGYDAFSGCSGLTSVTIGIGVTSIGDRAFEDCSALTSVTIPDSVTNLEAVVFSGCSSLTNISVAPGNPMFSSVNGFLLSKSGTTLVRGLSGNVTIPDGVTSIGLAAFCSCTGLTDVTMPDSVTSIEGGAFSGCSGLTSVAIGNGVTTIGDDAFEDCNGLRRVTIPDGVTSIGYAAFEDCSGLTSVAIPDSVTNIGVSAFRGCSGLTNVTLGKAVTSIGYAAFEDCSGLKELRVPKAWKGTSMLNNVWGYPGKPEGCEIIYYEPEDSGEVVAVPEEWMDKNAAAILAANGWDYEAAAKAEAANGMAVWECYLAGLSPMDPVAEFKVKSIEFVDGEPVVKWDPDLNEGETKKERSYVVEGAETLDGAWGETNAASRFFRVRVGLP